MKGKWLIIDLEAMHINEEISQTHQGKNEMLKSQKISCIPSIIGTQTRGFTNVAGPGSQIVALDKYR